MEEGFEIMQEEIAEAVKDFNSHKKAWEEIKTTKSPIEERMVALEEVLKKSLTESALIGGPSTASGAVA